MYITRPMAIFVLLLLTVVAPIPCLAEEESSASASTSSAEVSSTSTSTSATDFTNAQDGTQEGASLENVNPELANAPMKSDSIYEFTAAISTGFEYSDNVENSANDTFSAFMTHIRPSFSFQRLGGRITADISYAGKYTFYLQEKSDPDYVHTIDASVTAEVVKNFFFINISESMEQIYEDITRGEFQEGDSDEDTRNRNVITIAPYISLQPTQRTNLTVGYTFTDTRYSESPTGKTPSFLSIDGEQYNFIHDVNQSHNGYFKVNHELSERASIYTGGGVTRTIYQDTEETDITRYTLYVGGAYAFSEDLSASIEIGPNYSVADSGDTGFSPYVNASLNYAVGRSVFSLSYKTSFEDDPEENTSVLKSSYDFSWAKSYDRTKISMGIAYNTFETEVDSSNVGENQEEGNTISPRVSLNYELTDRLTTFLNYSGTFYEDHSLGDHKHTGSYGLRYALSENSNVSLTHRIFYTIPQTDSSYWTNQVSVDLAYTF